MQGIVVVSTLLCGRMSATRARPHHPGEAAQRAGPPVQAAYVRVTAIQGSWTLVPTHGGGSLVTYVVASDPGGALPTWLVNRAQRHAAPAVVKAILDRVKQTLPREGE